MSGSIELAGAQLTFNRTDQMLSENIDPEVLPTYLISHEFVLHIGERAGYGTGMNRFLRAPLRPCRGVR